MSEIAAHANVPWTSSSRCMPKMRSRPAWRCVSWLQTRTPLTRATRRSFVSAALKPPPWRARRTRLCARCSACRPSATRRSTKCTPPRWARRLQIQMDFGPGPDAGPGAGSPTPTPAAAAARGYDRWRFRSRHRSLTRRRHRTGWRRSTSPLRRPRVEEALGRIRILGDGRGPVGAVVDGADAALAHIAKHRRGSRSRVHADRRRCRATGAGQWRDRSAASRWLRSGQLQARVEPIGQAPRCIRLARRWR
jgi:hypothetical protein